MPRTRRRVRSPCLSISPTRLTQQQPSSAQPANAGFYKDSKRRRVETPSQLEQHQQQPHSSVHNHSKVESSVESSSARSSRKRYRTDTESRKQSQHYHNSSTGTSSRPQKRRREKSSNRDSESSDRKAYGRAVIEDDDEGNFNMTF